MVGKGLINPEIHVRRACHTGQNPIGRNLSVSRPLQGHGTNDTNIHIYMHAIGMYAYLFYNYNLIRHTPAHISKGVE